MKNTLLMKLMDKYNLFGKADNDNVLRHYILVLMTWIGIIFLGLMSVLAYLQEKNLICVIDGVLLIGLVLLLVHLRAKKNVRLSSLIGISMLHIFLIFLFINGSVNGSGYVWIYIYPLASIFLLGSRYGTYSSLLLISTVLLLYTFSESIPYHYKYDYYLILRLIPSYFVILFFTMGWEKSRRTKEQLLYKAREEAEKANRAKDEFLSYVSHELRTPLNSIIGFSELLEKNEKDKSALSYLEAIHISGNTLLKIINNILDLSKIEAGKMEVQKNALSLRRLFRDIQKVFQPQIHSKNLEFHIVVDKGLKNPIISDETKLRQILFNLLSNAVKFTSHGSVTLKAEVLAAKGNTIDLGITVADTGMGIPKDQQQKIFEAFSQQSGQQTRDFGGTGLGLTIIQKFVQLLGGKIQLESEPGRGSVFQVILKNLELDTQKITTGNISQNEKFSFESSCIILYSLDKMTETLLKSHFDNLNINTIIVRDLTKLNDLIDQNYHNILVLDITRKVAIDAGYLKEIKKTHKIPIILISADRLNSNLSTVADNFLLKPFESDRLTGILKMHLPHNEYDIKSSVKNNQLNREEIEIIKKQFGEKLSHLKNTMFVDDFVQLADEIIELGKRHSNLGILSFGKELEEDTKNYAIDNIIEKLQIFDNDGKTA